MKKSSFFLLFSFILMVHAISATANPQKQTQKQSKQQNFAISLPRYFATFWRQADSLAALGQPRSALAVVDQIYTRARAEKNDPQVIKAIIYRIRLNADFEENFLEKSIHSLQLEIAQSAAPRKQVLQSILAEVFWKYYQVNQYRFRDRSKVKENQPDSIETWDLATLFNAITRTYLLSLGTSDSLKKIPIEQFETILEVEAFNSPPKDTLVKSAAKYFPTLYDFIAGRALDFFTSAEPVKMIPAGNFKVDQAWYFSPSSAFTANRMMIPGDTSSPASFALRIFRDLATFHLKDTDPRALIEAELKRFTFVQEESIIPGKDSLYLDALRLFEQSHIGSPWGTAISYTLAEFLNGEGQHYQPLVADLHKWDIRSAAEVCNKAIQRFPESDGANNCTILLKSIKEPFISLTAESAVPTDKPSLALVGWKNQQQLYFRLVKADHEAYREKSSAMEREAFFKYLVSLPATRTWTQKFPDDGDFQKHQAEIAVPGIPAGFWVLLASGSKDFSGARQVSAFVPFWSTQIAYISKRNDNGSYDYYILDRSTGSPLKNARVEVWVHQYNYREREYSNTLRQSLSADDLGYLAIPPDDASRQNANQFLKIYYKNDFLVTDHFYQYAVSRAQEQTFVQTLFYTDRGIYRPGQNIYYKGIVLERTGEKTRIKPKHNTKVTFTDANGRMISTQSLTSNEFGSVSGSFTAPAGVLPGQMTIYNETGSVSFSVEEYKRPAFEVTCDPLEDNYRLGGKITMTGKAMAYAGNPIDAATVKYRVVRTARFPFRDFYWRWPMPVSPEVEITNGLVPTAKDGRFSIEFTAVPDQGIERQVSPVFDYLVYADVTDINGETRSATQQVSVGYKSLVIGTDIPEMVNLSGDSTMKITTANLNGRHTPATVKVALYKLRHPGQTYVSRTWDRPDLHVMSRDEFHAQFPHHPFDDENNPETWEKEMTLYERTLSTGSDSIFNFLAPAGLDRKVYDQGSYLLVLSAIDPFGETVEVKRVVTFYQPASKEVPVNAINWFVPLKTAGEPGEKARFLVGSKEENVNLIYEIRVRDSLISREQIRLNGRAMVIEIPIRETYRGNFGVNFVFVRHNRAFQNSQVIKVPHVSKKLDFTFGSFRSKLDPGAKETWKITITGPGGKPASAEFMASMYDASLDIFRPNKWSFNLYERLSGIVPWDVDNTFRSVSGTWYAGEGINGTYLFHPGLKLNWFGLGYFGGPVRYSRQKGGVRDMSMQPEMMDAPMAAGDVTGVNAKQETTQEITADTGSSGVPEKPVKSSQAGANLSVRRDFRETAFFYPDIHTDSAGTLTLQFTVPESLTRWNLLGLAHTKNLDNGLINKEILTQKAMMVFPNAPRFVRQGDTVIFSAKIVNMADSDLNGKVTLSLTDGITQKNLDHLMDVSSGHPGSQSFSTTKGQSTVVNWRLIMPVDPALAIMQYRITADAGTVSDGEENAIPVLTNRMMVTESLPLPVRGKGTFEFSFAKLLNSGANGNNSLKNYRLTLEFASNPAWYAIQALPSLNNKSYETADAIFDAWWSNSIASFIANSNPKIRAVFESWKNLTPDALQSNLVKNQDLKTALLQETPWVMEAGNETARKQRLGLFFDQDNLTRNLAENLRKLQKLQTPNGGWTWLPGMPENRYITQEIVTGIGKLLHLGITGMMDDPAFREMVVKAVQFLDGEIRKDYENLKRYHAGTLDDNHLGSSQIQYLYARSFFMTGPGSRIPDPSPTAAEAFGYYRHQAEKYWLKNDRYLQGMIALALNRLGNKDIPAQILKSLSEKALHSAEMGMYWAGERGYYWYQAPIETQAMMVEVFDEVGRDEASLEELRIWLLKQKQTQDWRSPRATLEACYALLLRGTDLLSEDPELKITLGSVKIDPARMNDLQKEAGTGYFRMSWSGSEIRPEMGKIKVSRPGQGIAWGAVYWQYFEDMDKITPASTPLHLEKKLFVERNTASGPVLEAVTSDEGRGTKDERPEGSDLTRSLSPGDKLVARIILTVDRDLEYVHMKDLRASSLESHPPAPSPSKRGGGDGLLSGYRYQDGLGYYQSMTDQAANFFFDYLPKGTYVFEYPLRVNAAGDYSNGITTIQCLYAPEFTSHSEGVRIRIK